MQAGKHQSSYMLMDISSISFFFPCFVYCNLKGAGSFFFKKGCRSLMSGSCHSIIKKFSLRRPSINVVLVIWNFLTVGCFFFLNEGWCLAIPLSSYIFENQTRKYYLLSSF